MRSQARYRLVAHGERAVVRHEQRLRVADRVAHVVAPARRWRLAVGDDGTGAQRDHRLRDQRPVERDAGHREAGGGGRVRVHDRAHVRRGGGRPRCASGPRWTRGRRPGAAPRGRCARSCPGSGSPCTRRPGSRGACPRGARRCCPRCRRSGRGRRAGGRPRRCRRGAWSSRSLTARSGRRRARRSRQAAEQKCSSRPPTVATQGAVAGQERVADAVAHQVPVSARLAAQRPGAAARRSGRPGGPRTAGPGTGRG